jgi:hypothetical protein
MLGTVIASRVEGAPLLRSSWTTHDIVQKIREHFDLDYSFFEGSDQLESARRAYNELYESEEKYEQRVLSEFSDTVCAYAGKPVPASGFGETLDDVRSNGRRLLRLTRAATLSLFLTGVFFVSGLVTLAVASFSDFR